MVEHKELGKITRVKFGFGGYQDCQIVFEIEVGGRGWGSCMTYECGWSHVSKEELEKNGHRYQWTHEGRIKQIGEKAWEVVELMKKAKVESLAMLEGIPIEATFDGPFGKIRAIRVLEEVI